jgi:hypothetical protein
LSLTIIFIENQTNILEGLKQSDLFDSLIQGSQLLFGAVFAMRYVGKKAYRARWVISALGVFVSAGAQIAAAAIYGVFVEFFRIFLSFA